MALVKIQNLNCLWFKKLVEVQEKKTHMVQWLISKTFSYILRRNFHGCSTLGYLTQFCSDEIYSFFDSNFTDYIIYQIAKWSITCKIMMDKKSIISYLLRSMNTTLLQDNKISKYNLFLQHLDKR